MTDRPIIRPIIFSAPLIRALLDGRKSQTRRKAWGEPITNAQGFVTGLRPSPWQRVQPGDRLYVRENIIKTAAGVAYAADGGDHYGAGGRLKITPCIHMPRVASRLTLDVSQARMERLKDISREDAIAEGFARLSKDGGRTWKYGIPDRDGLPGTDDTGWPWDEWEQDPRDAFRKLWGSLHGADAWDANPELVVIGFTVARRNIDAMEAA